MGRGKAYKYTYKKFKKVERIIVRDAKGRFKKYLEHETLDQPKGKYKIVEMTINMSYKGKGKNTTPSNQHDFEVLIRYPEGEYNESDFEDMAREAMEKHEFPESFIDSLDIVTKSGKDLIGYGEREVIEYMIVDRLNPQYKYPKGKRFGELE